MPFENYSPSNIMAQQSATSQNEFTQGLTSFVTRLENQSSQKLAILSESEKNGESSKKVKEPEEENVLLPEELIEKIIARMPFPSFFKARILSKAWCAKFRLTREGRTTPLQNELEITAFPKWTTYDIVSLCRSKLLYGFDRISCRWESIFSLSDLGLRRDLAFPIRFEFKVVDFVAPLMLLCDEQEGAMLLRGEQERAFYVINIFTRSWRKLCQPRSCTRQVSAFEKLIPDKSGFYKVLFVYIVDYAHSLPNRANSSHHMLKPVKTVIYDSRLNEWTETISQENMHIDPKNLSGVYLHGKIYVTTFCEPNYQWELYICNVDTDQKWIVMPLIFDSIAPYLKLGVLLLCGQKIMMVSFQAVVDSMEADIDIYQLDLHTFRFVNVFKDPPRAPRWLIPRRSTFGLWVQQLFYQFASDDNFIYYYDVSRFWSSMSTRIFNLQTLEWVYLPYDGERRKAIYRSPFLPGQNSFLWTQP